MIQQLMRKHTSAEVIGTGAVKSCRLLKLCHLEENKPNRPEPNRQI